jgi:tRNA threonylcarbamoyladenosine biosynthesis protein TsaE
MTQTAFIYESHSAHDTGRLAERLARMLKPGTVLALDGDLGAGKTTFSQALARALGVPGVVNSPTFTIIKEYEGERLPFYHMDVYRLSAEEAEELGLDDYFFGEGVTLVEWASLIAELLPEEKLTIEIETTGPDDRVFRLSPEGGRFEEMCRALKEDGILK